jgi:hypothetical protein
MEQRLEARIFVLSSAGSTEHGRKSRNASGIGSPKDHAAARRPLPANGRWYFSCN